MISKKVKKKNNTFKKKQYFLIKLGKSDMVLGKKGGYFRLGMGPGQKIPAKGQD